MIDSKDRATFSSTLGTVLTTAGVAIGLGNVWRFPYMMGKYGGAVFLLVYLLIVIAFGIPALMGEWALGRATRRSPWQAFARAGMPGGRWFSYLLMITVIMAASYYAVVIAWVLYFALAFGANTLSLSMSTNFDDLTGSFSTQLALLAITNAVACGVLFLGVKNGIERISKLFLPLFGVLFLVLIVRSLTLPGAGAGLQSYLVPNAANFRGSTALAAMGQAIFSLALGGTFMVLYGSYMRERENIPRTAFLTAGADVTAALLAGLIVVPSAFAFGLDLESGPRLMFAVMPEVFAQMPAGNVFGAMFFLSIFLVAILSLMASFEVIVVALDESLGWSRGRSLLLIMILEIFLAVPAFLVVDYVEISDLIWGTTMQPVGAAIAIVALVWFVGRVRTLEEIRRNTALPFPGWLFYWMKYGIPLGISVTLVYGWYDAIQSRREPPPAEPVPAMVEPLNRAAAGGG